VLSLIMFLLYIYYTRSCRQATPVVSQYLYTSVGHNLSSTFRIRRGPPPFSCLVRVYVCPMSFSLFGAISAVAYNRNGVK
jgi:hypothetical protein